MMADKYDLIANITGQNNTSESSQSVLATGNITTGGKGDKGDIGPDGPANTLAIGTVAKGDNASATITGTVPNQTLNLILPKGDPGNAGTNGQAATVSVGTVSTLAPGSNATVTNTGTTQSAVLNFGLPQGQTGAAQVNSNWNSSSGLSQILNKPNLASVATSGSYNDLSNKPTIPTAETGATIRSKLGVATLSGSNTGDQTNVTGNAGTATKFATARTINGVSFDGSANITVLDGTKVPTTRTINGHALSADVTVSQTDVGLGNVDNTSDASKPISTATQTALNGKANTADLATVSTSSRQLTDALGTTYSPSISPNGQLIYQEVMDNVMRRINNEVNVFHRWLNGNKGVMSEVGWPWQVDNSNWNRVIALMMRRYFADNIAVMLFTAQGDPGKSSDQLTMYTRDSGSYDTIPLDIAYPNAIVPSYFKPTNNAFMGIDVFGGAANDGGGSGNPGIMNNTSPGTYGTQWWYEGQGTYDYLASQGYNVARVGFRMERLYPTMFGDLEPNELARLKQQLVYAQNAGMKVVLDCHNYALYVGADGVHALNSPDFPILGLVDFWSKFSADFKNLDGIQAYSLMNEPHNLWNGVNGESGGEMWEYASQACLDAIRAQGDNHEVHVSVYEWAHLPWVNKNHRKPWIIDSAHNFRYEGHHYPYLNRYGAANYPDAYTTELTEANQHWINQMNNGATWSSLTGKKYNQLP